MVQTLQLRTREVQRPVQAEQRQPESAAAAVKNASIAQAQYVTHAQSLELVQTLLHASISTLTYLRILFPEACYDEQPYSASDVHISYQDYASGSARSVRAATRNKGASTFRTLRRGRNDKVDCLLDWLQCGAFEALKKNYLRALQLSIFEQPDLPSQVIETYSFTFKYTALRGENPRIGEFELKGPRGELMNVKNGQLGLQQLVRKLSSVCASLPVLPDRLFLNMYLFYTDDCPADYEPPLFRQCFDTKMSVFETDAWQWEKDNLGMMHAGFHSVGLKVSYLQDIDASASGQSSIEVNPTRELSSDDVVASEGEIGMSGTKKSAIEGSEHELDGITGAQPSASQTAGPVASSVGSTQVRANVELPRHETSFAAAETLVDRPEPPKGTDFARQRAAAVSTMAAETSTHLSIPRQETPSGEPINLGFNEITPNLPAVLPDPAPEQYAAADLRQATSSFPNGVTGWQNSQSQSQEFDDSQIRRQLRAMQIPSSQGDSYVETQMRESSTWDIDPNQKLGSLEIPAHREEHAIKLQFSQKRFEELEMQRSQLLAASKRPTRRSVDVVAGQSEEDTVKCQCGWNEEDGGGGMVYCRYCNTWQHLNCYGYCDADDPRKPPVHVCYNCLLSEDESPLLAELMELALLRRGLRVIEVAGYNTNKKFTEELHCDPKIASTLFSRLRQEGYVVPAPGKKSKGSSQTGKSKFCLASQRDVLERMRKAYFDPTTKVAHHFEAPRITGPEADLRTQENPLTQNQTTASIDATASLTEIGQSGEHAPLDRASEETDELLASTATPPRAPSHKAPNAGRGNFEVTDLPESQGRYSLRRFSPPVNRVSDKQSHVLANMNPNIATPSPGVWRKRKPDYEDANPIQRSTRRKRLKSSKSVKTLEVGDVE